MPSNLQRYPAYKPSGVEWLGDVPEHWEVRRLRSVAAIVNGATPSTNVPTFWDGDIIWLTPEDLGRLERRHISDSKRRITTAGYESCGTTLGPPGSVAISTRAPIGHLGILTSASCVNQGCRLLAPVEAIRSDYLYYEIATARPELESIGQGSTFTEISRGKLGGFLVAVSPSSEQAAIVLYLDYVDRRIRRYVSAKEKLIGLLEEEKQAVINRAVTSGLDPNVPLKPSGVEWLGEVPAHWERRRLKTTVTPIDRRSATGSETLLSLRRDYGVVPYAEHFTRPSQSKSLIGFKLVSVGQLVVNRLQANNGLVFNSAVDGVVSPDYSVFEKKSPLQMQFLSHLLRTSSYRAYFRQNAKGLGTGTAGFLRLYDDAFLETQVFLPPVIEQAAIVEYLDEATADIDTAFNRARRQIDLIQEYRTRLIADVVTGKLDVRAAAAGLPDAADDRDPIDESGPLAENIDGSVRDANEAVGELIEEGEVTV